MQKESGTSCKTEVTMNELEGLERLKEEKMALQTGVEGLQQKCIQLEQDNIHLREENQRDLEKLAQTQLTEECFKHDDNKVRYYTGLTNWNLLFTLLSFVRPFLNTSNHSVLSDFQQLLLTLMRLRLGLSGQDLGYRFCIHHSTVSHIFASVVNVLFVRLKHMIMWPDRAVLRKTLPIDFQKHCPDCTVIVDCFEILIDRPSALLARAQTYSNYKHHNTVKYLIGITPNGIVSFISSGFVNKMKM